MQERLSLTGADYPVIFMTAHDNPEWQERANKAGAIAYLRKPFREKALLDAIRVASLNGTQSGRGDADNL